VWGVGDPTLTPRIVQFLRRWPWIIHFGKWRGRNRWPHAHVRNVAAALFLAATLPDAAGQAITVVDNERTSLDEFYRIIAAIFLPGKKWRSITLPLWAGKIFGRIVSGISNTLHLDHPFADPTFYALHHVGSDLDFCNERFQRLLARGGRRPVTREDAIAELRAAADRAA
jgi:nucleoside-diphosphate-sugar epimerase